LAVERECKNKPMQQFARLSALRIVSGLLRSSFARPKQNYCELPENLRIHCEVF
jgi:hypothetical protein